MPSTNILRLFFVTGFALAVGCGGGEDPIPVDLVVDTEIAPAVSHWGGDPSSPRGTRHEQSRPDG